MEKFNQLTATSILSIGLALFASQSAHAATAYEQVMATAQDAAKLAVSKNLKGRSATCFIASRARVTAAKVGYKVKTPEFQTVIARTTHQSALAARTAKGLKIQGLLKTSVVVDCEAAKLPFFTKAAGGVGGGGVSLPLIGGAILGIGAVAYLLNDDEPESSSRNLSAE